MIERAGMEPDPAPVIEYLPDLAEGGPLHIRQIGVLRDYDVNFNAPKGG